MPKRVAVVPEVDILEEVLKLLGLPVLVVFSRPRREGRENDRMKRGDKRRADAPVKYQLLRCRSQVG
jgi:hypothetical protein